MWNSSFSSHQGTPRDKHRLEISSVGFEMKRKTRYLQRRWSLVYLSHSLRRGEKPKTNGVHPSCGTKGAQLGQLWSADTREPQRTPREVRYL